MFSLCMAMHSALFERKALGCRLMTRYYRAIGERSIVARASHFGEFFVKFLTFRCRDCGDCALPDMAYCCPQGLCAKQQRNGPCGGSRDGMCEVFPVSRGTLGSVDRLLVAAEPGRRSVETALRIQTMAFDIGLKKLGVVGNKVRSGQDERYLKESLLGLSFVGFLPSDDRIRDAEAAGQSVWGASAAMERAVGDMVNVLEKDRQG